jgi:ribosomal protein S21
LNKVVVHNGNLEGALKDFKHKGAKNGLFQEARKREEGYKKPGVLKRERKKAAIKNSRKMNREYSK